MHPDGCACGRCRNPVATLQSVIREHVKQSLELNEWNVLYTRNLRCPFCRAAVQINEEERKVAHAWPMCAGWEESVREAGMRELGPELIAHPDNKEAEN